MDTPEQSPYISYGEKNSSFIFAIIIFIIVLILIIVWVETSKSSFTGRKREKH